ncbi:MAG: sigma-70 family RNA polymerase sigma factor [Actinobacteria bacterium]|nr:sigma-70 family RNA polymerase sigma factor [Actinomycetota bacterium]
MELLVEATDHELLERAKAGDDAAFAALYRRHHAAARWVAGRWTRSPEDADDLVAQAFTAMFAALPRLDPDRISFRSYLFACVRNGAKDRARRQRRLDMTADVDADTLPTDDDLRDPGCAATLMDDALRTLPPRWQEVLWLTAVDDLPVAEVARRTSSEPGTVAAVAYRARKRLRAAYVAAHHRNATDEDCPACRALAS